MAATKIVDAPFTDREKRHLIAMGVVEADWGHPEVTLDNPVEYFRERVLLNDDPTLQMRKKIGNMPSVRGGMGYKDRYRNAVLHKHTSRPTPLLVTKVEIK